MLKKRIKYEDYNGEIREEDFYFNLNASELIELEWNPSGKKISETIDELSRSTDNQRIIEIFKDLLLRSYGEKSSDGRRFIKSDEIRKEFEQSKAFEELYMELFTNANKAAEFVQGIIPDTDKIRKRIEEGQGGSSRENQPS